MSVAYYIVLDNDNPGFDTFVNGKFVAANLEKLDAICVELEIRRIDEFLQMSEDDISDLLGDDLEFSDAPQENWFEPKEGIAWVEALASHIEANPGAVDDPEGVLEDLAEYGGIFAKADKIGAKWRLNLDI